jgi:hypothetical protein
MIRAALVLAIVCAAGAAHAQADRMGRVRDLSPGATTPVIELFTFGRGALIFEKFGHTALCINYAEPERETVCFNYGVTDFEMPPADLTWNFIRGHQRFWVEPIPLSGMVQFYRAEDRDIERQALPLPDDQARRIESLLLESIKPENRYYYYDHFADNCTTRLRDMIDDGTGGTLRAGTGVTYPLTFRQMGRRGLAEFPEMISFGDFAVGRALDRRVTLWQAMFHPFVLRDEVTKKFGVEAERVYTRRGPPIPEDGPTGRGWVLLIGLGFALPLALSKLLGRGERAAVGFAAFGLGLVGLIIWTAAIVSTIPGRRWNEAVLFYVPFDLVYPFLGEHRRRQYARVRLLLVVAASLLSAVGVFLQPLTVPIVIGFALHGLIALDPRNLAFLRRGLPGPRSMRGADQSV